MRWAFYRLVWIPEFKRTRGFGRLSFDFNPSFVPIEEEDRRFVDAYLHDVKEQLNDMRIKTYED